VEQQLINAVFENGAFRPLQPLRIAMRDGEHVRLRIEEEASATSIELATQVYDGLSTSDIDEIERAALDRTSFFSRQDQS
jgi:predicted DNA-binding antitoxin AbrB/MazE fold protein